MESRAASDGPFVFEHLRGVGGVLDLVGIVLCLPNLLLLVLGPAPLGWLVVGDPFGALLWLPWLLLLLRMQVKRIAIGERGVELVPMLGGSKRIPWQALSKIRPAGPWEVIAAWCLPTVLWREPSNRNSPYGHYLFSGRGVRLFFPPDDRLAFHAAVARFAPHLLERPAPAPAAVPDGADGAAERPARDSLMTFERVVRDDPSPLEGVLGAVAWLALAAAVFYLLALARFGAPW